MEQRLSQPEKYETLNKTRLRQDLLSSMPMCFNLFGELVGDPDRSRKVADVLAPGSRPGPVEVRFEWSPGRRSRDYTNDRTAFDAALLIGSSDGPRDFVGVETKYHEHAVKEPPPTASRRLGFEEQTRFLEGIADASGVFVPDWQKAVMDSELRQIWRDHVLALAMRRRPEWGDGRYLLVYPSKNTSFASAAKTYRELLVEGDTTFQAMTVDELVNLGMLHDPGTAAAFEHRYLWWMDESL